MARISVVSCEQVEKQFGQGEASVHALRGVDLTVEDGQMTLLVGPSGCGKTTLLCLMAGLLEPNGGRLEVLGQDLVSMPCRDKIDFRRRHLGFVFQQFNLLPALRAAENVIVPLLIAGWKRKAANEKAQDLLEKLGIADRSQAFPRELSGGQQQRVAIARALIHEPRLILCDEPTSALDHATGQSIMALLKEIAVEQNRAVVVVSHDERVLKFGDRIVHMSDGRVSRTESATRAENNVVAAAAFDWGDHHEDCF
jgi:putative ABC transport system ATP-binding protein